MALVTTDNANYSAIAEAIRAKTGGTDTYTPDQMAAAIRGIQAGGGNYTPSASPQDVNFFDYDGTLVASYTLADAQTLAALPDGPTHDGLVFQGWNWSLEAVKALTRPMNVGAVYITDDGKTRLHIRVWDKARSNVPLYISQTVANGVTIDWGDGSPAETLTGTGNVITAHAYADPGDYTISLSVADGCILGLGHSSSSYCVMGNAGNNGKVYCNLLQEVHIGANMTKINGYAFQWCSSLTSITIPNGVTNTGIYTFTNCSSLKSITIPSSVTDIYNCMLDYCYSLTSITIPNGVASIGGIVFNQCFSLATMTIPDGVTSIGNSAFGNCCSLTSITIPDSVISIGNNAFINCYGMAEYHLKPATPPALGNTSVFGNIPSDCVIYVPRGSLEAYQTDTNWATYADYMQEETV